MTLHWSGVSGRWLCQVAGQLPPFAEGPLQPEALASQGLIAKRPSRTPSGVMSSETGGCQRSAKYRTLET